MNELVASSWRVGEAIWKRLEELDEAGHLGRGESSGMVGRRAREA